MLRHVELDSDCVDELGCKERHSHQEEVGEEDGLYHQEVQEDSGRHKEDLEEEDRVGSLGNASKCVMQTELVEKIPLVSYSRSRPSQPALLGGG